MTNKKQPTQPNDYSVRYNHFSQPFKRPRFVFLTINLVMPCEQQRPKQNNRENPAFKTKYRVANIYLFSKHLPNAVCAWAIKWLVVKTLLSCDTSPLVVLCLERTGLLEGSFLCVHWHLGFQLLWHSVQHI